MEGHVWTKVSYWMKCTSVGTEELYSSGILWLEVEGFDSTPSHPRPYSAAFTRLVVGARSFAKRAQPRRVTQSLVTTFLNRGTSGSCAGRLAWRCHEVVLYHSPGGLCKKVTLNMVV